MTGGTVTRGSTTWGAGLIPGRRFDVAVVVPTLLRATLGRTLASVYDQTFGGSVQILVGIDRAEGTFDLAAAAGQVPPNMALTVIDPGYSTMARHGGMHLALGGGSLRTALSFLASAPLIAYLDDDCWWGTRHLGSLVEAIGGKDWAFSLRWYIAPGTSLPLGIDRIESVGPGAGIYDPAFGGFCDTNTLMIDKTRCPEVLPLWCSALVGDPRDSGEDRVVLDGLLKHAAFGASGEATSFYELQESDDMHARRLGYIASLVRLGAAHDHFLAGDFRKAGVVFFRQAYALDKPGDALAWAACALGRAGDRESMAALQSRYLPAAPDLAWRALYGEDATSASDAAATCTLRFFQAQGALIDGERVLAHRRLLEAVATGASEQPEHAAAVADLKRLEDAGEG